MNAKHGIFAGKLCELETQYTQIADRLRCCQQADHGEIRRELQNLWQEYRENALLLQKNITRSRSPAVASLSAAQLEYDLKIQDILQNELPGYVHGEGANVTEDQTEAASLYGEYAMDFAVQAMRHALLAALSAIDLQMNCEEREIASALPGNMEEMPNE